MSLRKVMSAVGRSEMGKMLVLVIEERLSPPHPRPFSHQGRRGLLGRLGRRNWLSFPSPLVGEGGREADG